VDPLETFGFRVEYSVEIDPEFPGTGDWGSPVVGFDRSGRVMPEFDSRWGTPAVIRIEPYSGLPWVAMFAAGGLGSLRGVFATPASQRLAVVVDGLAYSVDVEEPGAPAEVVHDQVQQVIPCDEPPLLLLVRPIDIVALGPTGLAWSTTRLCVDDLRVVQVGPRSIVCSCDNLEGSTTITIDPATGAQLEGTRLDSFWPPDALA
jgi:hypothetical protein